MSYNCERCGYTTNVLCNFKSHLKRKNQCYDLSSCGKSCYTLLEPYEKDRSNFKFVCEFCDRRFETSQGKYQHKQHCKNKEIFDEKDQLINTLQAKIAELQNTSQSTTINNNNTINNNTINQNNTINENTINQNITITIVVNNFGNECLDHVINDNAFLDKCMKELQTTALSNIVNKLYYDKDHPENHTIFLKNIKRNEVMVHEDGEWRSRTFHETIPKLIYNGQRVLNTHLPKHMEEQAKHSDLPEEDIANIQHKKNNYVNDLLIPETKAYKQAAAAAKTVVSSHKFKI